MGRASAGRVVGDAVPRPDLVEERQHPERDLRAALRQSSSHGNSDPAPVRAQRQRIALRVDFKREAEAGAGCGVPTAGSRRRRQAAATHGRPERPGLGAELRRGREGEAGARGAAAT